MLKAYRAPVEFLVEKINIAERAIAARLNDQHPPDADERMALRDALRALRVLIEETRSQPKRASQKVEKKDIA